MSKDNANCRFIAAQLNNEVEGVSCDWENVSTNMFSFVLDKKITHKKSKKDSLDHMSLCGLMKEKYNILMFPSF